MSVPLFFVLALAKEKDRKGEKKDERNIDQSRIADQEDHSTYSQQRKACIRKQEEQGNPRPLFQDFLPPAINLMRCYAD